MSMAERKRLIEEGWEERIIACEPKLSELADLYREIGFEVRIEPLPEKWEDEADVCDSKNCRECYELDREKYRIIYTRPKK
jgi:hypothetical protein